MTKTLTAVVHQEGDWYVAECPETGTASQGTTVEEAVDNLREATELYLEEVSVTILSASVVVPFEASVNA